MAAKHFKMDETFAQQGDADTKNYQPKHAAGKAKPQLEPSAETAKGSYSFPQVQVESHASNAAERPALQAGDHPEATAPTVRAGGGTGWYYGEVASRQAAEGADVESTHTKEPAGGVGTTSRSSGVGHRIVAACVGGACVVAVVAGLGIWVSHQTQGNTNAPADSQAVSQQVESSNSNATSPAPSAGSQNGASQDQAGESSPEEDASSRALQANDVLSRLSALSHNGSDCSLPSDGAEVDVRDGRVLVAYESDEDAQDTVSRMASAAAALRQELSGSQLADSSTAEGGVSQIPAVTTPVVITASGEGRDFSGVEIVALGQGRYVIGAISLDAGDGLESAGEAAILTAASSYAVEGPAYRYSGLHSQGIAQSKGDAPTLLTGETIIMRMTVPQPVQATSSAASGSASVGTGSGGAASSRSRSSSGSASRTSNGTGSGASTGQGGSARGSGSGATTSTGVSTRRSGTASGSSRGGSSSSSAGGASGSGGYATRGASGSGETGNAASRGYSGTGPDASTSSAARGAQSSQR